MNSKYDNAVRKMEQFALNPETLFDGTDPDLVADHSASCNIDAYMAEVREPHHPTDDTVKRLLDIMCAAGADKLRKHASEHLPGGEYWKSRSLNVRQAAIQRLLVIPQTMLWSAVCYSRPTAGSL